MPRFLKGSEEAKAWADKMRKAKMEKMKGGIVKPPMKTLPIDVEADLQKQVEKKNPPMKTMPEADLQNPFQRKKPPMKTLPIDVEADLQKPKRGRPKKSIEGLGPVFSRNRIQPDTRTQNEIELHNINGIINQHRLNNNTNEVMFQVGNRIVSIFPQELFNRRLELQNLVRNERNQREANRTRASSLNSDNPEISGGFLEAGEVPPAAGPIHQKDDTFEVESSDAIDGSGMCDCVHCEMCGGKISMKKLKNIPTVLSSGTSKINPMSYAIKDKKSRQAMIKSGEITQDYIQPAVVSAGMPLYYGAAGTAGMMLGGPVGAMAATKGADLLYKKMVGEQGYDPRERQKSELLGAISAEVGKAGASQMKSSVGPSKKPSSASKKGKGKGIGRVV